MGAPIWNTRVLAGGTAPAAWGSLVANRSCEIETYPNMV